MIRVTQLTQYRPGHAAHWVGIELSCPHGREDGEARTDGSRPMTLSIVHQLIHGLIAQHTRAAGCSCASLVSLFCWQRQTGRPTRTSVTVVLADRICRN